MKRYFLICLLTLGFTGSAGAQNPDDITTLIENLEPASTELVDGLSSLASAVEGSQTVGDTVVSAGSALVQGTEYSAMSLALQINNDAIQGIMEPYLTVIDDPSVESVEAAFHPEDLNAIASNLEDVPEAALEGNGFGENGNGFRAAAIETLRGNIGDLGQGAMIYGAGGVVFPMQTLAQGTSVETEVSQLAGINALTFVIASEPVVEPLREPAAELGEAGAPLTAPVIAGIEAFDIGAF